MKIEQNGNKIKLTKERLSEEELHSQLNDMKNIIKKLEKIINQLIN